MQQCLRPAWILFIPCTSWWFYYRLVAQLPHLSTSLCWSLCFCNSTRYAPRKRLILSAVIQWTLLLHTEARKNLRVKMKTTVWMALASDEDGTKCLLQVFRVKNLELVPIDVREHGKFFSSCCYVIAYIYETGTKEECIIYSWLVRNIRASTTCEATLA